jgi:hypothetical protein
MGQMSGGERSGGKCPRGGNGRGEKSGGQMSGGQMSGGQKSGGKCPRIIKNIKILSLVYISLWKCILPINYGKMFLGAEITTFRRIIGDFSIIAFTDRQRCIRHHRKAMQRLLRSTQPYNTGCFKGFPCKAPGDKVHYL